MKKHRNALYCFAAISILIISFTHSAATEQSAAPQKPLTVHFLNVGHADATLIATPGGRHILIDAAGGKKVSGGKNAVLSFLEKMGIRKLDTVVMSHADSDHIGGMPALLASPIPIGELLDPGYPHTTRLYQDVLAAVKKRPGMKYIQPEPGQRLDWGKELSVRVINSCRSGGTINDCSIVIHLRYGAVSLLFPGDVGKRAEKRMADRFGSGLRAQVLKVAHHGSKYSSSERFIAAVRPEVAIISAAGDDPEGPYEEVVRRLRTARAKVYQTGRFGTITVTTDGRKYSVATEKRPADKAGKTEAAMPAATAAVGL